MTALLTSPSPANAVVDLFASSIEAALPVPRREIVAGAASGCFHMDIPSQEYHELPDSVSCSGLKHLLRSPAHYQAYLEAPFDEKPNLGVALHCAVLEPDVFEQRYTVYRGGRRGTKAFEAFAEQNKGKVILNETEWIQVHGMVGGLMTYDDFPLWAALQSARREMSIFWTDAETGVRCRIRLDALQPRFAIFDLKTTTDARPDFFIKQATKLDYDVQAAMYTEGAFQFLGERLPFYFAAIEEDRPHGIWLHEADEEMIENGMRKFRKALRTYKACQDSGHWPNYSGSISRMKWPRYAQTGF